jgi:hypothetical protein
MAAEAMHAAIFVSEPCCFDFEIRPDSNFLGFYRFLTGFPCVCPKILTFANGGPVGTKMPMLMEQERLPISEPLAGLLAEQTRAQTLHRFALRVGVS